MLKRFLALLILSVALSASATLPTTTVTYNVALPDGTFPTTLVATATVTWMSVADPAMMNRTITGTYSSSTGIVTWTLPQNSQVRFRCTDTALNGVYAFTTASSYVLNSMIPATPAPIPFWAALLVPYTGATGNVTLGAYKLTAKYLNVSGHATASLPTGTAGDVTYDTTTNTFKGHNGTSWGEFAFSSTFGAYLPLAGGTMSGGFGPDANFTYDVGTNSFQWRYGYFNRLKIKHGTAGNGAYIWICNASDVKTIDLDGDSGVITATGFIGPLTGTASNASQLESHSASYFAVSGHAHATSDVTSGTFAATFLQNTPTDLGDADYTVDLTNSHTGHVTNLTLDGEYKGTSEDMTSYVRAGMQSDTLSEDAVRFGDVALGNFVGIRRTTGNALAWDYYSYADGWKQAFKQYFTALGAANSGGTFELFGKQTDQILRATQYAYGWAFYCIPGSESAAQVAEWYVPRIFSVTSVDNVYDPLLGVRDRNDGMDISLRVNQADKYGEVRVGNAEANYPLYNQHVAGGLGMKLIVDDGAAYNTALDIAKTGVVSAPFGVTANLTGNVTGTASGNLTAEADTLGTVTGRGASTSTESAFSGGLVAPDIRPAADSTTAVQINKANGTTNVLDVDTTNARVGVGTTAPEAIVHVRQDTDAYVPIIFQNANTGVSSRIALSLRGQSSSYSGDYQCTSPNFSLGVGYESYRQNAFVISTGSLMTGGLSFIVSGAGPISFNTGGSGTTTERMRILADGKVGIGTQTPDSQLNVVVPAATSAAETVAKFTVGDDANAYFSIANGSVTDGQFAPIFTAKPNNSNQPSVWFVGVAQADSGTTPAIVFDGRNASSALVTKPLFGIRSYEVDKVTVLADGRTGIGTTSPTAVLHLKAGTATVGTAPVKFTAGTNLTSPEAGALEFDGTYLYYTTSTPARKTLAALETANTWTKMQTFPDSTIKASKLQNAASDMGAANVTVNLSNSYGSYVTNLITDGAIATPQIKMTPEGGLAVSLVAGEALTAGEVVYVKITSGADGKVWKAPTSSEMPVGIVYASADADAAVWVVTSGIASVLPESGITAARGNVIFVSASEAGRVSQSASTPTTEHWRECGHFLGTGSGNGAATRALIHFN